MIIRYAEVLISYAEALYELNGSISDSDLDITVNALRRRVLPVDIIGAKFNDDETPKQRTDYDGHLTETAGMLNGKTRYDQNDMYVIEFAEDRKFNPAKDYLYPVPLYEIANSGGNVTQNPGWE